MNSTYLVSAVTTLLGKVRSSESLQFTVDKAFQLLGSHHILGVFFKLLQFSDVILFNSCENCWTIDVFLTIYKKKVFCGIFEYLNTFLIGHVIS